MKPALVSFFAMPALLWAHGMPSAAPEGAERDEALSVEHRLCAFVGKFACGLREAGAADGVALQGARTAAEAAVVGLREFLRGAASDDLGALLALPAETPATAELLARVAEAAACIARFEARVAALDAAVARVLSDAQAFPVPPALAAIAAAAVALGREGLGRRVAQHRAEAAALSERAGACLHGLCAAAARGDAPGAA